jgi:peptide/nickel transport system ATP-binding protein
MILDVQNLSTSFQTPRGRFEAVKNVSFKLAPGESIGIVGESGCGKSVTALSILRLIQEPQGKIDSGKVVFKGQDLLSLHQDQMRKVRGKSISMIFQEPMTSLNPVFTIGDQILESIQIHQNLTRRQGLSRCLEIMNLVGMPDPKERFLFYPHQLSGGLRQRAMIAMALACEPEILIADEPTTALDVSIQAQILDLIKNLQEKMRMSLILITHDFGVISKVTDQVMVMYAGEIVEKAPANQILSFPKHPYTRALQASIPNFEKRGRRLYSIPFSVPGIGENVDLEKRWQELSDDLEKKIDQPLEKNSTENVDEILRLQDLKVYFSSGGGFLQRKSQVVRAVDGVSLSIKKGEILGLVGESGCGKSSLGKSILKLAPIAQGEVRFKNQSISKMNLENFRPVRKSIQIIFQDPYSSLNPRMKVGEILSEPLVVHRIGDRHDRKKRVLQLLDKVGLKENAYDRYPHEFSGGQRQRIGIARALAVEPEFIVADEPVSALDVSIQAQILNLLLELKDEFDLTYLFISHDLNVVQYLCDRILVMNQGKIVEELSPEEVQDSSFKKDPYTQSLIDAIPQILGPSSEGMKIQK